MTEPTDADRKHAAELIWHTLPREQVEAVARALAGERERARKLGICRACGMPEAWCRDDKNTPRSRCTAPQCTTAVQPMSVLPPVFGRRHSVTSGVEMVCPVCSARQDAGLLCASCTDALEKTLGDVRSLVADLDVTLSRQARIGTPGKGGLAREKSPVHFGALEAADTLGNVLTTWARDLMGGRDTGSLHSYPALAGSCVLRGYIDAIRRHPAVAELVDEITDAVEQARRVIDRPADRMYLGQCMAAVPDDEDRTVTCYAEIWARVDAHEVACRTCGITHDVAERRRWLLERSHDVIATVKQASEYVGEFAGMAVNQKTIRTWMDRGKLPIHVGPTEERHLRLGDLLTILTEKATRSAA